MILSNLKVSIDYMLASDFIFKHSPSSDGVYVYFVFKNERFIAFEACIAGFISAHGAASLSYYYSSSESVSVSTENYPAKP